jgi:hypothetical protein
MSDRFVQRAYDKIPGVTETIHSGVWSDSEPFAERTLEIYTANVHADITKDRLIPNIGYTAPEDVDTICAMLTDQRDWLTAQRERKGGD